MSASLDPTPPPQRRLRADAERNLRRLLEATREAVAAEGPDVGIEAIATRAGVGIGTIYRRFQNKQALLDAAAEDRIAEIEHGCRASLEQADAWDGFCQLAAFLLETQIRDRGFVHAVGQQLVGPDGRMAAEGRRAFALVADVITRAQSTGGLRPDVTLGDVLWTLSSLAAPPNPVVMQIVKDPALQIQRSLTLALDGFRNAPTRRPLPTTPPSSDEPASDSCSTPDAAPRLAPG